MARSLATAATVAFALALAWSACSSDDGGSSGESACQDIIDACHLKDPGSGELNDCHQAGHDGVETACADVRDECVQKCDDAPPAGTDGHDDGHGTDDDGHTSASGTGDNETGGTGQGTTGGGSVSCADIADACHDAGPSGVPGECHDIGHDGDESVCAARGEECLAAC